MDGLSVAPSPLPRSFGALDLEFVARDGVTRAFRAFQQGVMRVRFPHVPKGAPPEAVLINVAGGLTGGDCITMDVMLGADAHATITTQAHEKVYRASLGTVVITAQLGVESGAQLEWLPQPTILFDRARLTRRTDVTMAADAQMLAVEAVIFGRMAMSEVMREGALDDQWTIRRGGRLIHFDRFALENEIDKSLARAGVLDGHAAMATIRHVAPDAEARLDMTRELLGADGAASAWNGMLVARIVARDGQHLSAVLARLLPALRGRPLPPIWTI
jgi:urease accessory protein